MGSPLNKDSKMECARHGLQKPSFICKHLQYGEGLGFYEATDDPDPEYPFREAWCGDCDKVLLEQAEWNDISEGNAQIMPICEGCLTEIQARNE
ncbi:hypothetical protein BEL05_08625 [Shewanella colwelliana]|uniref:Uncharacterized protein n=1 Tax=Shewanella colwelliana TaxID=23 RepID=A0A1E5ITS5_SHECO|nr:hypothetical protein [Shewanella colwelliana]OEG73468.1 hypothetical protein BEL05_08625 [Shewanella colwelliana]